LATWEPTAAAAILPLIILCTLITQLNLWLLVY
jgi:hypothetical protein